MIKVAKAFTVVLSFSLLLVTAQAGHADLVVNVSDANNWTNNPASFSAGTSDQGTLALTTPIADQAASGTTMTYTISGLDVDGIGGADDTVDITFAVTTEGANIRTGFRGFLSSEGAWLNSDADGSGVIGPEGNGDFVQIAIDDISVNLNGGMDNGLGDFIGFTALQINGLSSDETGWVNGSFIDGATDSSIVAVSGDFAKLEFESDGGATAGSLRVGDFDFQFSASAVPEPSSAALFGLGLGTLVMRRRRRLNRKA